MGTASAQPPNVQIGEAIPPVGMARSPEQIKRWVLGTGNASAGRQQLGWQLRVQMEDIDRACSLTDAQRRKLELAGQGDIKHFFDHYEQLLRKSQVVEHNEQNLQEMQREANHLRRSLINEGLFLEHSLLVKSLRSTLTDEQFAQYEAKALKGRALGHHESVLEAVAMLKRGFENSVAARGLDIVLREEQRQDLIRLMMRETKPPSQPSQYDVQFLLLQFSRLPEENLKRLFDADQWEIMKGTVDVYQRVLEPRLRHQGLLLPVDRDGDDSTAR